MDLQANEKGASTELVSTRRYWNKAKTLEFCLDFALTFTQNTKKTKV